MSAHPPSLPCQPRQRPARLIARLLSAVRNYEREQFERPHGPLGWLAGQIMAVENRTRNAWAVELLAAQASERVIEVGFGPGVAIERIARTTAASLIAGVDHSAVMLIQASRRNRAGIASGRIDLRLGALAALPFADGTFDRALLVNALHFSAHLTRDLAELRRVLRPAGHAVIVVQPVWTRDQAEVQRHAETLTSALTTAGFGEITLQLRPMQPVTCIGLQARR